MKNGELVRHFGHQHGHDSKLDGLLREVPSCGASLSSGMGAIRHASVCGRLIQYLGGAHGSAIEQNRGRVSVVVIWKPGCNTV